MNERTFEKSWLMPVLVAVIAMGVMAVLLWCPFFEARILIGVGAVAYTVASMQKHRRKYWFRRMSAAALGFAGIAVFTPSIEAAFSFSESSFVHVVSEYNILLGFGGVLACCFFALLEFCRMFLTSPDDVTDKLESSMMVPLSYHRANKANRFLVVAAIILIATTLLVVFALIVALAAVFIGIQLPVIVHAVVGEIVGSTWLIGGLLVIAAYLLHVIGEEVKNDSSEVHTRSELRKASPTIRGIGGVRHLTMC